MSDLFQGRTMSEGFQLISGGAAYTITLGFDADKITVYNLTDWTGTAAGDRKSVVQGKSVDLGGRRIIKKKKIEDVTRTTELHKT